MPLSHLLGAEQVQLLEERLAHANLDEAVGVLQTYLHSILRPSAIGNPMIPILSKLYYEPMQYSIHKAIEESGYSQRQFERICSELIGMSGKRLHKITRFNKARLRILFHPDVDLHQCMLDLGYYDYAHFSKEFKLCLGVTPSEFQKWMLKQHDVLKPSGPIILLDDGYHV
ncbi:AraC family transcriptional regulator [Paenibacillus sp. H1-7]|uniref:helix-turn-helix domain-containing protein n=1 Tax=Paenibacillus sp. H1-7 TaxID=2282849 RepID=UPI001EF9A62C|nr:helix-turn-helix domain-containing protein [Paenibacillus sp. H1-7]ULL18627.1 AraC family transcriptional regulator [Paenibacillus sp. H1-7]